MRSSVAAFVALLLATPLAAQDTIAFPGATGWGAYSKGGSVDPADFCHVTNLDDTGAGSFRDCAERDSVTVVFDTAGVIALQTNVDYGDYLTIAGQTAQGDLIIYRQFGSQAFKIDNNNDQILAYLSAAVDSGASNQDNCLITGQSYRIYWHHTGCFGDNDESFDISPTTNDTVRNVSIERHISAMTMELHKGCWLVEDDIPDNNFVELVSMFQIVMSYCGNRAPWLAGGRGVRMDNGVAYAPSSRRFQTSKDARDTVAFVRGFYKNGPATEVSNADRVIQIFDNDSDSGAVFFPPNTWYNNYREDSTTTLWAPAWCDRRAGGTNVDCSATDTLNWAIQSWPAHFIPTLVPPSYMATAAYDSLITNERVGRYRYMGCDGNWVTQSDTLVKVMVGLVRDSTGPSSYPSLTNFEDAFLDSWPPVAIIADSMCTNSDGDALPDRFEILTWSDLTTSDGSQDGDNDGFRDFTEYAWGYSPTDSTSLDGTESASTSIIPLIMHHRRAMFAMLALFIMAAVAARIRRNTLAIQAARTGNLRLSDVLHLEALAERELWEAKHLSVDELRRRDRRKG